VTFAVESPDGAEVARGKDLQELQERLTTPARRAVAHAVAGELERTGLRDWPDDLDELPRVIERAVQGRTVRGFPAFVDTGGAVDLRVLATPDEQHRAIGPGLRRLVRLSVASPVKAIARQLDPRTRLTLGTNPDGDLSALLEDCADAAADTLMPTPVWTRGEFVALQERLGKTLAPTAAEIARAVERVLAAAHDVRLLLPTNPPPAHSEAIADVRAQLDRLLPPGFVTATGRAHLADLTRYLLAIRRRLDGLARGAQADRERMDRVHAVQDAYDELLRELPRTARTDPGVLDIARQIEELRVSLWAQQLGTPRPVSEQRIYRAMDAVRDRR
jgi:ATP-dependent helicase HrpA